MLLPSLSLVSEGVASSFPGVNDRVAPIVWASPGPSSIAYSSSYNGPRDVVCKVSYGDIDLLKHEAEVYTSNLAPLQGIVVPRSVGLFLGEPKGFGELVACLVLEYCGDSLDDWLGNYSMDFRYVLLFSLL